MSACQHSEVKKMSTFSKSAPGEWFHVTWRSCKVPTENHSASICLHSQPRSYFQQQAGKIITMRCERQPQTGNAIHLECRPESLTECAKTGRTSGACPQYSSNVCSHIHQELHTYPWSGQHISLLKTTSLAMDKQSNRAFGMSQGLPRLCTFGLVADWQKEVAVQRL